MGRPKKDDAKKPGQLAPGLCYFSFVGTKALIDEMRSICSRDQMTIKQFMQEAIRHELTRRANAIEYELTPKDKALLTASISNTNAPLPEIYQKAKILLIGCTQLDECKNWADKALALGSYAKQANDESLEKLARQIRATAMKRAGELLTAFNSQGINQHSIDTHEKLTQRQVAQQAGMSKDQSGGNSTLFSQRKEVNKIKPKKVSPKNIALLKTYLQQPKTAKNDL